MVMNVDNEVNNYFMNKSIFFGVFDFYDNGGNELFPHFHEAFELAYFEKGEATYSIDSKEYLIKADTFIFLRKNVIHGAKIRNNKECKGCVLKFDLSIFEGTNRNIAFNKYLLPIINGLAKIPTTVSSKDNVFSKIKSSFFRIIEIFKNKPLGYELVIISELYLIFFELISNNMIVFPEISKKELIISEQIEKIILFIDNNYKNNIKIKDISKLLYFNESYSGKFFKKHIGLNFLTYLSLRRLEKSKFLLINSKSSITDICFEVGFQDLSYFIKLFKKKYGLSPSHYRENICKL